MTQQQQTVIQASFKGPVPPPNILAQYNDAMPDGADRLMRLAEGQTQHRMKMEEKVIDAEIKRADRGLIAAVIVALAGLTVALVMFLWGEPWVGGGVAGIDIAGVAGTFLYGTKSRKDERAERSKRMSGGG